MISDWSINCYSIKNAEKEKESRYGVESNLLWYLRGKNVNTRPVNRTRGEKLDKSNNFSDMLTGN